MLSLHAVPDTAGAVTHPEPGLHESVVQGLPSLQASVPEPGWHVPDPLHASPTVQELPSLHDDPAEAGE